MGNKQLILVLDTNVWLDNYVPSRSGHEQSKRLIDLALSKGCVLSYSVGCAKDVFYMIASLLKAEIRAEGGKVTQAQAQSIKSCAWSVVDNMSEIGTAIGADASDVWFAGKLKAIHNDLEGDLVLAAARRAGADFLVTNDQKLLRHADCGALCAKDTISYLEVMH